MDLSLLDMVGKLVAAEIGIRVAAHEALERVAVAVEDTAKSELGVYQPAVGPFGEWAELADATKEDRVARGFTENEPLLRTGELRDSIGHRVDGLEAEIGSTNEIMVYQELGTTRIPPRPVLGPAAERNHDVITAELGGAVVAGLLGGQSIGGALGYDKVVT
jgi:hypothetical protein